MTTITPDDEYQFTHGGCLVLAKMISEQTGWPLCALLTRYYGEEPDIHAFVRTPDGRYLDVEGLHDEAAMLAEYSQWQPCGIGEFYPEDFDESWPQESNYYGRQYEQRGAEIAPELIKLAQQYALV